MPWVGIVSGGLQTKKPNASLLASRSKLLGVMNLFRNHLSTTQSDQPMVQVLCMQRVQRLDLNLSQPLTGPDTRLEMEFPQSLWHGGALNKPKSP